MDTKALRQKILNLAIRGKLVPQDPNDEPASVLLERIRAEKQQMVKEGKLKAKDIKNDTVIFKGDDNLHYEQFDDGAVKCIEEEIPFELPEGWAWVRIHTACIINPRNNIDDNTEVSFVPMANISEGYANSFVSDSRLWRNVKTGYTHFAENDIGIAKITPCFENKKSVVFTGLINGYGAGTTELHIIRTISGLIVPEYLLCFAKRNDFILGGVQTFSGDVGQQRVTKDYIANYLVSLPPLNEQKRIISAIKEAYYIIENIEKTKLSLIEDVKKAKSKILDLAIRGKLVPQDPNDEPASVLLERIRAEKEELIKQGKIKRDKKESVIFKGDDNSYYRLTSDNKRYDVSAPFDLPDCWEWTTFPTVAHVELGKTLDKVKNTGTYYPYLRSVNVQWGYVDLSDVKEMKFEPEEIERYTIKKNDLLICEGGDVGRCCVWNKNESILYQNAIHRVRFYNSINCNFYMYFMMYLEAKGTLKRISNGVTIKHLTNTVLSNIIIPLPPLAEQERIVNAVETLFTQIDKIAEQIS